MKHSISELIVERYYKLMKYLVEKDVPILPQSKKKIWSDLDILAVEDEVLLISCKDFLPDNNDIDKVIKNLNDAEIYIKQEYKYLKDKKFIKKYVYGGTGKQALQKVRDNDIETIEIKTIFSKYLKELDKKLLKLNQNRKDIPKGKRYYIIGELENLDKFLVFLLNNNFIKDDEINIILKKENIEELSKPK